MDWTIEERYGIPIGTHCYMSYPKEVCLVSFTLHLSPFTRKQLYRLSDPLFDHSAMEAQ